MKYSSFMFVNHLLSPAIFHLEIWEHQELTITVYETNSDCPADFYAGGVPCAGRSIKTSRVLEGLVGVSWENLAIHISGQSCFCKRFLGMPKYIREQFVVL